MPTQLNRTFDQPDREGLSWDERWLSADRGLIWCWELGRQMRTRDPELARRAVAGELVILDWRGGVEKKLLVNEKRGTLNYLATWQGLRGEDLNIVLEVKRIVVCSRTQQTVVFSADLPADDE